MSSYSFSKAIVPLHKHRERLEQHAILDLFSKDENRFQLMSNRLGNLVFDYSKTRLDEAALSALLDVAEQAQIFKARDAMLSGAPINTSEHRSVLHTALRNQSGNPIFEDGEDVIPEIAAVLKRMAKFSDAVRSGAYTVSGGRVTDVVNIGIGGSDLGPVMAVTALRPYHDGPRVHFVSNVDGADLADTLQGLNPETTLFIIASKTFTTIETMTNAGSALTWLKAKVGDAFGRHFTALSTNLEATRAFGIEDDRTFGFWDWVGGRYSIWSAIGLSLMIAIGKDRFQEFLEGGNEVDEHFATAPMSENIPVIMALLGVWHRNVWGYSTHAVLPYDNRLSRFPAYLQQLDMESNGKSITKSGEPVAYNTGPVVWGEPGTNGQHAFYQLIHQGTDVIPADFLIAANAHEDDALAAHHSLLVANCLAQTEALMIGKDLNAVKSELKSAGISEKEVETLGPQKVFSGNRPTTTFMYERLDPKTLGMLIALYEHKVFVQGVLWGINSFDQWGVELGKVLAKDLQPLVDGKQGFDQKDGSTAGLLAAYHTLRN